MIKFFRKFILWFVPFVLAIGCTFADTPDSFSIDINETINLWEFVDFTVNAVKDWELLKEYTWTVFFDILDKNNNRLDSDFYTLPENWFYIFVDTDQWRKTFSKWLEIRKSWTYTIVVRDLFDNDVVWKIVVEVNWGAWLWDLEPINLTYPTNWSVESKSYVKVIWASEKLKNSPVIVYLNDKVAGSGTTDAKWIFEVQVAELISWANEIQAKIIDKNWVVMWESPVINVEYRDVVWGAFKFDILPWRTGKQWDKFVFNLNASDTVSSASLMFSNGLKYSMDRIWQWLFSKELVASFSGDVNVSLSLTENWNENIYENIDSFSVAENIGVSNIQFVATWVDGTKVIVSWDVFWTVPKFQINYGLSRDDLNTSQIVGSNTILVENLEKDKTYFFQIVPMDLESHKSWDPSDIVEYRPAALACVVKWIKVRQEQIWDNYYLVWDEVENAISYEVYRSEWADMTNSRLVWNLTGTRFQYLFNPDAKTDEYAYYQVQAICPDWKNVIVDEAKKVKVWPVENILLVIVISIFVYSLYRLNRIWDEN